MIQRAHRSNPFLFVIRISTAQSHFTVVSLRRGQFCGATAKTKMKKGQILPTCNRISKAVGLVLAANNSERARERERVRERESMGMIKKKKSALTVNSRGH